MGKARNRTEGELVQGTLDMLILKTLGRGAMHGYGIAQTIQTISDEVLRVEEGSLYPALHRLELDGMLASEWGQSTNNRRAKYYRLTAQGRKLLGQEAANWNRRYCSHYGDRMKRFVRKMLALRRRRQLDRDLDDELRFHLAMKTAELGDPSAARRRLGNITSLAETCRELWAFTWIESCWQDLRYAVRTLGKTPLFTLVAVMAIALGIGADTAVFTIASGAFTWNLGLAHVDKVMLVDLTDRAHNEGFGVSYPDFTYLRSNAESLAGLAAYRILSVNLSDRRALPERYHDAEMSANGFFVSEQKPAFGRTFLPSDEQSGAPPVVVLTYHVWQDRYGNDPAVLGKTIRVNEVPRTIVGILPPGKRFPEDTDIWTPLIPTAQDEDRRNRGLILLFGRLADGASLASSRTELAALASRLASQYPRANGNLTADLQPIARITGAYNMRPLFAILWTAVGFVLLIACADVANMLLARSAGRAREISIRSAIGAGRGRIVRQLLIESVMLSFSGGFLGWLVSLGGLRWFDAGTRSVQPPWLNLSLDAKAFTYLTVISLATGLLFGLAPALGLSRIDILSSLKDGGVGLVTNRRVLSISNLLVVFEMTLCIVLLAGSGLMIRSAVNLYDAPVGVDTRNVLTMHINLPEAKYPRNADRIAFHRALHARLSSIPGVESVALASHLPFGGSASLSYQLEGARAGQDRAPRIGALVTSPDYYRVMRLFPKRGRVFTTSDGDAGPPVVLVNERFAVKVWGGVDPLGKHLRLVINGSPGAWLTVVGVLPDVLQNFHNPLEHDPLLYLPYAQAPQSEMFIVSRTHITSERLADLFRRSVQNIDENLPIYDVRTLANRLAQTRLATGIMSTMFSIFAFIALILAALGLYAVIAHSVSQRTQEIGIRLALGGTSREILQLVYLRGLKPLWLGLTIGVPAALALTHLLRRVLIGVSPGDPLTFAAVILVLLFAGLLGCAIPAHRATRVAPVVALRYE
jgi:predicted permease/transcriptional regulator